MSCVLCLSLLLQRGCGSGTGPVSPFPGPQSGEDAHQLNHRLWLTLSPTLQSNIPPDSLVLSHSQAGCPLIPALAQGSPLPKKTPSIPSKRVCAQGQVLPSCLEPWILVSRSHQTGPWPPFTGRKRKLSISASPWHLRSSLPAAERSSD